MKRSRYNLEVVREDESSLLYNTLSGSLTELSSDERDSVQRALKSPSEADPAIVGLLAQQGHLVADEVDELAVVARRRAAGIADRNRLDVIVLTTLDCNLGCEYCYETREPGTRMSKANEAALCAFLDQEMPRSRLTILQWFGGEPLLDTGLIVRVSQHANAVAVRCDTTLALHITTNGYLLGGWRRDALLAAGVKDFQVTLDGPPDTHNRSRPLRSGRASFDRIFANITDTVCADEAVGMTLRVNINHTNLSRVAELLPMFEPDVRRRLRLTLEPIFGDDSVSATANIAHQELASQMGQLYAQAEGLGYEMSAAQSGLLTGRLTYCYAERDHQIVIKHDGSVFKCAAGDFSSDQRLGRLRPDGTVESSAGRLDAWMAAGDEFPTACQECVYLPLCMGGCRKTQFERPDRSCTLVPSNAHYVLKQIGLQGAPVSLLTSRGAGTGGGEKHEDHFAAAT